MDCCPNTKKLNYILRNKVNVESGELINPTIKKTLVMNGNIIPKINNKFDLGSEDKTF